MPAQKINWANLGAYLQAFEEWAKEKQKDRISAMEASVICGIGAKSVRDLLRTVAVEFGLTYISPTLFLKRGIALEEAKKLTRIYPNAQIVIECGNVVSGDELKKEIEKG
jgi:hypothetical protein